MRKINTVPLSIRSPDLRPGQIHWFSRVMALFILTSWMTTGCDTRNGVDREAIKQEMANRELKRLRNSDIVQRGEEIGKTYFSLSDTSEAVAFADSLNLKVIELKSGGTEEERELLEAFLYASENNQDLDDYVSDTNEEVFFYHPEMVGKSLVVTRLTISKKEIVRSL